MIYTHLMPNPATPWKMSFLVSKRYFNMHRNESLFGHWPSFLKTYINTYILVPKNKGTFKYAQINQDV